MLGVFMPEIENPYAQATVENFRRTPASLRPQLLKMLERELNGAEADQAVPATSFRRIPFDDRAEEFHASLKFRVLPLGNAMTVLISSSLINPVPTVPSHSF